MSIDVIYGLVDIRRRHGLTQSDVAHLLYVTPSAVNQFENSRRAGRSPTLARVTAYAQVVGAELRVEELIFVDPRVAFEAVSLDPTIAGSAIRGLAV